MGSFNAVVGLYAAIGALLGYALMGGVRKMSVGPEATIALLTASIIAPWPRKSEPVPRAGCRCRVDGGPAAPSLGIARLGFVAAISPGRCSSAMSQLAIVMIVSQLDSLIGIALVAQDDTLAGRARGTVRRIGEPTP